jgi:hypothetical protein
MTRFANPKAMQNFTNQFGATAAMGGNPRGNVKPKPQVGGTRPMGTGTPQIPPQNINPIRPGVGGTRPPGVLGTTGGPKPAPAVQLPVAGTRPVRPNQNPLYTGPGIKKMGMKKGGKVSSASKRADGCAVKGKTKGKMV